MSREESLLSRLEGYAGSDFYPFHMPGHKRNAMPLMGEGRRGQALLGAFALDITEIDGFDNLHEPEGILREAMGRAARLYGADAAFYSVNGSTAGILAMISAAVPEGGKLIMARNCHKAVYHAVYLRKLRPVYLYPRTVPQWGIADVITAGQVEEALQLHPDAAAVLLVSPTYDGVVADVGEIAGVAHRFGVPLLVDAAHGAHFGFHPGFPDSPVHLGADAVVVSLHKTLPCMTQTGLLLVKGERVEAGRVRFFMGVYQTSSPSYLLMASMDSCIRAVEEKGSALWDDFFRDREDFLKETAKLSFLRAVTQGTHGNGVWRWDPGKILLTASCDRLSGKELYNILLERYHLQMEAADAAGVTAIVTCCDRREGWQRLAAALREIDALYTHAGGLAHAGEDKRVLPPYPVLEASCRIHDAVESRAEKVWLCRAGGRVSAEFINLYPPGIPIAVPGERLDSAAVRLLEEYEGQGLAVCGVERGMVRVLQGEGL